MSDDEWVIDLVEKVGSCNDRGDTLARLRILNVARTEACESPARRMGLLAVEAFIPKLDGESAARQFAEKMMERLTAARTIIKGDVNLARGSTFGSDNSNGKAINREANGR